MTTSTSPLSIVVGSSGNLARVEYTCYLVLLLLYTCTVLGLRSQTGRCGTSTLDFLLFFIASDVIHRLTYRFHPSSLQDTRTISTTPTNSLGFSHLNTNHILIVLVPHQTCNHSNNQATLLGPNVITTL